MTSVEKSEKADRRYDLIVWDWDGTIMDPRQQSCIAFSKRVAIWDLKSLMTH